MSNKDSFYNLKELDTQIEITKSKIKYAKQRKDFICMEDMNSLLKTLINAKNTIEYYRKKEHKHFNAFNSLFKSDDKIFEEVNNSIYTETHIDNNGNIQLEIINEKGKKLISKGCLKFETPKTR